MKKWNLIFFMTLVLLTPIVYSVEMCSSSPSIDTSCRMVSPVLSCSVYNYSILNVVTSEILVKDNLTLLNDSIYYFNFSKGVGDYLVTLCDDTTREVRVGREDDNMGWLSLVIAICFMTYLFFSLSKGIEEKKMKSIKLLFFMLSVVNTFMIGFVVFAITANPTNIASFKTIGIAYFSINALCALLFIYQYAFYLLNNDVIDKVRKKGG